LDEEGRELSEHDARNSVAQLLREGFLPDAVINLLLSLGTEPPTELFTLPEAVEWFDLFALSPDPVRFDRTRLRELNRRHLLRMDERTLSRIFRFADPDIGRLAKLYLNQAATIDELESRIGPIFAPKPCDGPDGELLRTLSALIVQGPYCRDYEELRRYLSQKSGIEGERLDRLLLRLFTGSDDGPSAAELYPHIKSYITEIARCQH
jgi:glutamyl-tRNA synthetase